MGKAYKRNNGCDILKELEKERTARLHPEGQLAEMKELVNRLLAEMDTLQQEVAKRDEEIVRLKSQINKDSSNSSRPPSNNGFKKIANNREKSGKKQGGQKGHKGAPPRIGYGNTIKGLSVYLSVVGLIAVKRIGEVFREMSGGLLTVAKATVQKFTHDAVQAIDTEPLITDLLNGTVMNVDETPVKTTEREKLDKTIETSEKTTLSAYIRTYSNGRTTVLTPNAHKNAESVEYDNILPRFFGIVVQDYEAKFLRYGTGTGLCGAHLSRELKGLAELEKIAWADDVRQFFRKMNEHKTADIGNGVPCDPDILCDFENKYDELVSNGQAYLATLKPKSYAYKTLAPMVKRLSARKSEHLLFIRNYEVPYTNNLAERDLRHCKTKQKMSGCYRSWQGLVDYCKLRSLTETARKRGNSLLEAIVGLIPLALPAGQ